MKTSNGTIGYLTTAFPISKGQTISRNRPFVRHSLLYESDVEVERGVNIAKCPVSEQLHIEGYVLRCLCYLLTP